MAVYEKLNFDYSTKNIPICNKTEYKLKLLDKIRNFCRRIRIKIYFCTDEEYITNTIENKETYGFKSKFMPKLIDELKEFENEMFNLVKQVKFRKINDIFQSKLANDLKIINKTKNIIVPADKTTNFYKIPKQEYNNLLLKSIRKEYKKGDKNIVNNINKEAKEIVNKLKLEKKIINQLPNKQCYITLKDHKTDFNNNPKTRLINPCYSDIGQISKFIIDKINNNLRKTNQYNQWKSTQAVIKWYKNLEIHKYKLMKFDIENFYPSITERLLKDALNFANKTTKITQQEKNIIFNAAKSVLYNQEEVWIKRKNDNNDENKLFDITMGGKHGAEVCELIGLYILQGLKNILPNFIIGLYRDDGLIAVDKKLSNVEIEKIKKKLHKFTKSIGINIIIENPSWKIDYLDLNFNLLNHTYYPFRKDNNKINYINSKSNHPPTILRQIPKMVETRLSNNSSNKNLFNKIKKDYNDALKNNGYNYEINYTEEGKNKKRNRKRKIIWFNPPYCKSVKTNIGKKFLKIINKYFGENNKFKKYLNKNNIKLSYSCMTNIETIIKNHNKKLINNNEVNKDESCNCRKKEACPLNGGECRAENVIYQATIETDNTSKIYIGLSANQLKKRISTHNTTIKSKPNEKNYLKYKQATELSKLAHKLKNENQNYKISWKILQREKKSKPGIITCRLCLKEALLILESGTNCINRRTELMNSCRHRNKFLLINWKADKT